MSGDREGGVLRKLNLGCGSKHLSEYINLDIKPLEGVDVVHNIEDLPLPFDDNRFDEILCQDILEHVEYIPVLKDLYRILAPGGVLRVRVPHYSSRNNFTDPTHRRRFAITTFDYFAQGTYIHQHKQGEFLFTFAFTELTDLQIHFDKKSSVILRVNYLLEWWVNRSPRNQLLYEMTGLHALSPASDITVTLVK